MASKPTGAVTSLELKKMEADLTKKNEEIQCLKEEIDNLKSRIEELSTENKDSAEEKIEQHKADIKKLTEQHAEQKIAYQTELESVTEKMLNASSTSA